MWYTCLCRMNICLRMISAFKRFTKVRSCMINTLQLGKLCFRTRLVFTRDKRVFLCPSHRCRTPWGGRRAGPGFPHGSACQGRFQFLATLGYFWIGWWLIPETVLAPPLGFLTQTRRPVCTIMNTVWTSPESFVWSLPLEGQEGVWGWREGGKKEYFLRTFLLQRWKQSSSPDANAFCGKHSTTVLPRLLLADARELMMYGSSERFATKSLRTVNVCVPLSSHWPPTFPALQFCSLAIVTLMQIYFLRPARWWKRKVQARNDEGCMGEKPGEKRMDAVKARERVMVTYTVGRRSSGSCERWRRQRQRWCHRGPPGKPSEPPTLVPDGPGSWDGPPCKPTTKQEHICSSTLAATHGTGL